MSDYAAVVRANHHRTTGYLVANIPPCITIRDEEIQRIQRRLVALEGEQLSTLEPGDSWLMGVILCPGDDTTHVAAFANRTRSPHRIRFYAHPEFDARTVFSAWTSAGHRRARVDEVDFWKQLHPLFGKALNDQVYEDFSDG